MISILKEINESLNKFSTYDVEVKLTTTYCQIRFLTESPKELCEYIKSIVTLDDNVRRNTRAVIYSKNLIFSKRFNQEQFLKNFLNLIKESNL